MVSGIGAAGDRVSPVQPGGDVRPWKGSKGPALDAYDQLVENGLDISFYYTMFLSPLNPKLIEELRQKDLVIVPELNYMGQFSMYLRSYGIKAESITQYVGLPFKVSDLVSKITDKAGQSRKESVTV